MKIVRKIVALFIVFVFGILMMPAVAGLILTCAAIICAVFPLIPIFMLVKILKLEPELKVMGIDVDTK